MSFQSVVLPAKLFDNNDETAPNFFDVTGLKVFGYGDSGELSVSVCKANGGTAQVDLSYRDAIALRHALSDFLGDF